MKRLHEQLRQASFGLSQARSVAAEIAGSKPQVRALVRELFGDDVEVRKRAADVARRITERDSTPLRPYFDELSGLLEALPIEESRTRWHLGLVVPRVANTRLQRLRAARAMMMLAEDESNVVRCAAVEGLCTLALAEESLFGDAAGMIHSYLRIGTTAMKSRARHAEKVLMRHHLKNGT